MSTAMVLLLLSLVLFITLLAGDSVGALMPEPGIVSEVKGLTEQVMTLNLSISDGSFVPPHGGKELHGKILTATRQYPAGVYPAENLHAALKAAGWGIDYKFGADSSEGTAFAYRKEHVLCVFRISWSPGYVDYEGLTDQQEAEQNNVPHAYAVTVYVLAN